MSWREWIAEREAEWSERKACIDAERAERIRTMSKASHKQGPRQVSKTCTVCEAEYEGTKNSKYCSKPCRDTVHRPMVTSQCAWCGRYWEHVYHRPSRTCSYQCAAYRRHNGDRY